MHERRAVAWWHVVIAAPVLFVAVMRLIEAAVYIATGQTVALGFLGI